MKRHCAYRSNFSIVFVIAILALTSTRIARAQSYPAGFTAAQVLSSSSLSEATCFAFAPDGRIFIGVKQGTVRVWKPGVGLLPTPFHTFSVSTNSELGVIGMTLDPDFPSNGHVYVQYNATGTTPQKVVRLSPSAVNPDVSDPASEIVLLSIDRPSGIHNAGCIRFGPDGKLYVAVGEKSTHTSQDLTTLFGKILRINRDGSIPADNPTQFDGVSGSPTGIYRAIWAIGFRNPFRFAIHPVTGRLFVNDVSDANDEEIDDILPGKNYGFPQVQGTFDQNTYPDYTEPKYAYARQGTEAFGNAIIGSAFYSPDVCTFPPEYFEDYFFGDLSTHTFRIDTTTLEVGPIFGTHLTQVTDMHVDSTGRLWALRKPGVILRIEYTDPLPPVVVRQPSPQSVCGNSVAVFNVVVSGSMPLTYQWQRDGQPIGDGPGVSGSATRELTLDAGDPANAGSYRCAIVNANGNTVSDSATFVDVPVTAGQDGSAIGAFVEAVLSNSQATGDLCAFDFDESGAIGLSDVSGFVDGLVGGA